MIAIDTNILVRFLTKDDPKQYNAAFYLFEKSTIFIAKTVLLETNWVLRSCYHYSNDVIVDAFEKLIRLDTIVLEDRSAVEQTLRLAESGLDFADAMHFASMPEKAKSFYTFDRNLIAAAAKNSLAILEPAKFKG